MQSSAGPAPSQGRTRTGCLVCRSRRIKCDQAKPTCMRCEKYGAECRYVAQTPFDEQRIAIKLAARHAKKATPSAAASIASSSPGYLPVPARNAEAGPSTQPERSSTLDILLALGRNTRMGAFYLQPTEPPEFLRLAFPDEDELRCIHHCLTYSLSIMVVDETKNPWVAYVAPLFLFPTTGANELSVAALRWAMLALGATHLSYLQKRSDAEEWRRTRMLASLYRNEAVRALRTGRRVPTEQTSNTFLAATTILLGVSIFAVDKEWREIWRYALAAIRDRGGIAAMFVELERDTLAGMDVRADSALLRCIVGQLALIDSFAALATGAAPVILNHKAQWWERLNGANDSASVESVSGMDGCLIRCMASIAECVSHQARLTILDDGSPFDPQDVIERELLQMRIGEVRAKLEAWYYDASTLTKEDRTRVGSLALWHACQILLRHRLSGETRTGDALHLHARAIIDLCVESGDKIEYLNWPLLIGASVTQQQADRDDVQKLLDVFAYQCCYEIEVLRQIIEVMWERMDQGRDDESVGWTEVMVEIGWPVLIG